MDSPRFKRVWNLYHDIETGLTTNPNQLYKKLNKEIPLWYIKNVISKLQQKQIKVSPNEKTNFIPIIANVNSYMMDLTFYNDIKKVNGGYGTILNIININSRFLYSYLLKNKETKWIINAFKKF